MTERLLKRMSEASDPLIRVKRAALSKRRSDEAYRAALRAAVAEGASFAEVARAAGVSRQAVRQLVARS